MAHCRRIRFRLVNNTNVIYPRNNSRASRDRFGRERFDIETAVHWNNDRVVRVRSRFIFRAPA